MDSSPTDDRMRETDATSRVYPTLLADRPIEHDLEDRLGFGGYADALAELLDNPLTDTPLTIAITGRWGSGKTSLARMVERRLHAWPEERGEPQHITCWFDAWMHDDAANLGAALAAEVARAANPHRPFLERVIRPLPGTLLLPRHRWLRRILIASLVAFLLIVPVAVVPSLRGSAALALGLEGLAGVSLVAFVLLALVSRLMPIAEAAGRFIANPELEASRGRVQHAYRQLRELIHQATQGARGKRRLVIFVDNLERCTPPRAIDVSVAASQLLGHRDVITVLVADMAAIAESAGIKHARGADPTYGRRFVSKIVQIEFGLPPAAQESMRHMLTAANATVAQPAARNENEDQGTATLPREVRLAVSRDLFRLARSWSRRNRWKLVRRAAAGWSIAALVFLLVVGTFTEPANPTLDQIGLAIFIVLFVVGLAIVILAGNATFESIRQFLRRRRARTLSEKVDASIQMSGVEGQADPDVAMADLNTKNLPPEASYSLVQQRLQRYLVTQSEARVIAEEEVLRALPSTPREAKRLFNHLHLLLAVAFNRRILSQHSQLSARHLARWLILQERWPKLATVLVAEPKLIESLEVCNSLAELRDGVRPYDDTIRVTKDMFEHLRLEPALASVLETLIRETPIFLGSGQV